MRRRIVEHIAFGVYACFGVDHHGRAIGFPLVFLLAGVLQTHATSWYGKRQQCCVSGGIVCEVMAIATRALHMLATHFAGFHAQHFGDGQTSLEHRLAVGL